MWDSKVLGEWAKYQRICRLSPTSLTRVINSLKLRIFDHVTVLELPVIFLASPNNMKGPVAGEIWYVDGSDESCRKTRTALSKYIDSLMNDQGTPRGRVNTVANEKVSWLWLLEVLQRMERDSTSWESHQWRKTKDTIPEQIEMTTLSVCVQPYKRVFDRINWKQFDRNEDKYRAEGNGLSMRGTRIESLGLVFTFEPMSWFSIKEKRVIPTSDVGELCFGNAPTFYRPRKPSEDRVWQVAATTRQQTTLMTLRLGSQQDLSATLALIGCNQDTISHFLAPEIVFEIMGMLCRTCHLRNRCFTYLPNPTMHHWNTKGLSLRRLLSAFCTYLHTTIADFPGLPPSDMEYFQSVAHDLDSQLPDRDQKFNPIHQNKIHDALSRIDDVLSERSTHKAIVLDVMRRHLQELLQAINEPANGDELGHHRSERPSLKSLFVLPPEYREHELMRVYFLEIRKRVVSVASTVVGAGNVGEQDGAGDASLVVHLTSKASSTDPDANPPRELDAKTSSTNYDAKRNTIWCALVFRMICWLLLHDFDEEDVQLPKSDVQGNYLPVYIL
ncbi:hypothetical protein ONZ43_g1062 [Nemania bipapillata]|uniref:Uncharacterized protein n=1 Tax=Nemania bipapillata TaxID=110536 RepID=A0ACC2J604_9PEZI|nr:hypothetical protein ONZ43_g1062 [Nemania bipapillata]